MTAHQPGYWLVVLSLFVGVPLLLTRRPFGRRLDPWLSRLASEVVEWLRPEPEPDQLADDLYQVLRREKLCSDIRRLQRIVATDMSMSATRQLGNRLAHQWLLRELGEMRDLAHPMLAEHPVHSWHDMLVPVQTTPRVVGYSSQAASQVETLDIGWRR